MEKKVEQHGSLLARLMKWFLGLIVRFGKKQKIILGVSVFLVYLTGVFVAALEGNYNIGESARLSRGAFMTMKCEKKAFMTRAKMNTDAVSALLWQTYPVASVTTAIFDNPECLGALAMGMTKYPGRFVLIINDEKSGEQILRIVKN